MSLNSSKMKNKKKHKELVVKKKEAVKVALKENEPNYVVQLGDPKMLRKDVLEALREVILFMQGYDKFRKVQEEKLALFSLLKNDVRELNTILDLKLKKYLPRGKLKLIKQEVQKESSQVKVVPLSPVERIVVEKYHDEPTTATMGSNELEELENQLKNIESQLKNIK